MATSLDELDKLSAIHVMGFSFAYTDNGRRFLYDPKNLIKPFHWQPTRNIAQAWELLERFSNLSQVSIEFDRGYGFDKRTGWNVKFDGIVYETWSETPSIAITNACLRRVGAQNLQKKMFRR